MGPRGRSRIRDPPRAVRRTESRRAGATHVRPGRQGRDLSVGQVGRPDGPTAGTETADALEFLARVLVHIPDKGHVTTRYYGWYANRPRVTLTSRRPNGPHGAPARRTARRRPRAAAREARTAAYTQRTPLEFPFPSTTPRRSSAATSPTIRRRRDIGRHSRALLSTTARGPVHGPRAGGADCRSVP